MNKSTEAQRRFIEILAREIDKETFETLLKKNFGNGKTLHTGVTLNQNLVRMTKTEASALINDLKNAKDRILPEPAPAPVAPTRTLTFAAPKLKGI